MSKKKQSPTIKAEIENLVEILNQEKSFKKLVDDSKKRALELIGEGFTIPGFEAVESVGRENWVEKMTPGKVYKALHKWIANPESLVELSSPATVKKYIKESPEALAKLDKLTEKKTLGQRLSGIK